VVLFWIARSFERIEKRIDEMESRIYSRIADVEDMVAQTKSSTDPWDK
jgi:hypothetical protein